MRESYTFDCISALFRAALRISRETDTNADTARMLASISGEALVAAPPPTRCTAEEVEELAHRLAGEYCSI